MKCWETLLPLTVRHPLIKVDLMGLLKAYQKQYLGARGCVKTHFPTIESACSFCQTSPYQKIDRCRICAKQFSHGLAMYSGGGGYPIVVSKEPVPGAFQDADIHLAGVEINSAVELGGRGVVFHD
jgi:hypothetical protein